MCLGDSALESALNSDVESEMPESICSAVLDPRGAEYLKEDDLLSAFQDLKLKVGLKMADHLKLFLYYYLLKRFVRFFCVFPSVGSFNSI